MEQTWKPTPPQGLISLPNRFLEPAKVISIAVHRLATGGSDIVVGTLFGVSSNTVYRATERFVNAVLNSEKGPQLCWPNASEALKIKREFQRIAGFPNCVGAVDCTHVNIECPPHCNAIEWRDRTHKFSMVLQAIVSPSLKILDICTGWPGSVHDQRLFYTSYFYQNVDEILGGPTLPIVVNGQFFDIPENIVGDAGYMQSIHVMTPYSQVSLDLPHATAYNNAHQATRKCVERAFGRLKNQWHYIDSNSLSISFESGLNLEETNVF
jgi:nuclease HARBI1